MTEDKQKQDIESILLKKKERLILVLEISRKQIQFLKDDDIDYLLETIEARQKLIDEIVELDEHIEANGLKNSADFDAPGAQALLGEMKSILQEIAQEDRINIGAAEDKVEQFKHQIRGVKNNKSRIVSYQSAPANGDGIYIDKKK
jgi:hypothetical protein